MRHNTSFIKCYIIQVLLSVQETEHQLRKDVKWQYMEVKAYNYNWDHGHDTYLITGTMQMMIPSIMFTVFQGMIYTSIKYTYNFFIFALTSNVTMIHMVSILQNSYLFPINICKFTGDNKISIYIHYLIFEVLFIFRF
jgi:hypothetical protein